MRKRKAIMTNTKTLAKRNKLPNAVLNTAWNTVFKSERVAFGLVITLILAIQTIVIALGFVSVSADDYARTLYGANWAKLPYAFEDKTVWLPGQFYLLGLGLKVHYDLFLTPRIVTIIFSYISLGMLYLLTRKLFNRWVALLSILIVGLLPAHVYLSLTPMADIISLAFIISFLYFFFVWLDNGADRQLLIAAVLLSLATSIRFENWFIAAIFALYLGLCWLTKLWQTRSLHPRWLLAIGLTWLPPFLWILRNYIFWGDPFHFIKGYSDQLHMPHVTGPLTTSIPKLGYVELLLQNGALVCLLAVAGIKLSYRFLARKIRFYLALGLAPLVILTLFTKGVGASYKPHYVLSYLTLLTPFCAYAIYWAIAAPKQPVHYRRQATEWSMLAMMYLYNLWLVYIRFTQQYNWVLICLLALTSIALSYRLLNRKHWLCLTFSLSPLPILMLISKSGLASDQLPLYTGLCFVFLTLFYAYDIRRASRVLDPLSPHQWRTAGLGILTAICLFNLWGSLFNIPLGMPADVNKAGLLVRQLFEESTLAKEDKVLIEIAEFNYLGIQVMSNHPENFIMDRAPMPNRESFLLDKNSSPYEIGTRFTSYEERTNPFSLDPPLSLDEYLKDQQIRLVIIKDPRLETLLIRQTRFERTDHAGDYLFYYTAETR
jgi:hypothetical protein